MLINIDLYGVEPKLLRRELEALREAEQAAEQNVFALQPGHEKSQALAEYWNARAALDAFLRSRLLQQVEHTQHFPRAKRRFVVPMIDTVLAPAAAKRTVPCKPSP